MKGRNEQVFWRKKAKIMEACFNCYAENGLTGTGIQALADKQTKALEALVSQHRSNYEIETHPEWLTVSN